jgi:hypothetical protein
LSLFLPAPAHAQDEEPSGPVVPLVGRPENFSGASGRFYGTEESSRTVPVIETSIEPEEVAVEEPCLLRVRITAKGPVLAPPERLPLPDSLLADFHVEELGLFPSLDETARAATLFGLGSSAPSPLATLPGLVPTRSWEFRFRLRPKRKDIDTVPAIAFCFHAPDLQTASRPFMTRYTDFLEIKVTAKQGVITDVKGPDWLFAWNGGPLLSTQAPPTLPHPLVLVGLTALPVIGCVVWYRVWTRLYPDAARQVTLRRSRAARRALADLSRLHSPLNRESAAVASHLLTRYLRERLDQLQAEPTPREVVEHLTRLRLPPERIEAVRTLMEQLDAHRFGTPVGDADLVADLRTLILALEDEPCLTSA